MNAIVNHFKRAKWEYICVAILVVMITLMLGFKYKWSDMDITVPLQYYDGEELEQIADAKIFTQQSWNLEIERLGAPFKAEYYDLTSVMHNSDLLTMKFFALFTDEPGIIVNLTFFSIFYLCGIIAYLVMRNLKIRHWIAVGGAFVYSMCTFISMRGIGHMSLAGCYFVPLSVLLCLWIYLDDDYLVFKKGFFRYKKTWITIIFACLIANNGIVYYPFFTCFLLVVAGVSKAIKEKDWKQFLKSAFVIACIFVFILIALIPIAINVLQNGSNSGAIERNGFSDAELYGLRLIQLLIPVNSHGIGFLDNMITKYNEGALVINESQSSYLGIVGIIGFLFLIISLFVNKTSEFWKKIRALCEMNLFITILGVCGGFGTVVAIVFTRMISGYNRVSVFISFICVLAVCMAVDEIYKKYAWKALIPIFLTISVVSAWDQFPDGVSDGIYLCKEDWYSDRAFVEKIEESVPENSMIYQLPFQQYPEGTSGYIGYIHSKTLKWSYGSLKDTEREVWNERVGTSLVKDMVVVLKEAGFAGIYVDRRAYTEEQIVELEAQLKVETGAQPFVSENGYLSFFEF